MSEELPKLTPLGDKLLRLIVEQVGSAFPTHKFSLTTRILKDGDLQVSLVQDEGSQARANFFAQGVGSTHLEAIDALQEHAQKMLDQRAAELRAKLKAHTERQDATIALMDAAATVLAANAIE